MHVPPWAHERNCRISDPLNVIWEGPNVDLKAVVDHLDDMGWEPPGKTILWPEASDQFIPTSGDKIRQAEQRLFAVVPIPILKWAVRYHVRLWANNQNEIIGGAHYERIHLSPPGHEVLSFEEGERKVAEHFFWPPGQWVLKPSSHPLGNRMSKRRKAYNDGKATIIER